MIKAIHIEDEPAIIQLLKKLLETHCSDLVRYCGAASNSSDGKKLIEEMDPHLVYMDIQLKDCNAFQFIESLEERNFEIIFLTAYDSFALKAIKQNAADYLLKPIDIEELKIATKKVAARIGVKSAIAADTEFEHLKALKDNFRFKKIGLPDADGMIFVNTEDIIHAEAKGAYSLITLRNDKKITVTKNLKELEDMLSTKEFFRVHHSWVINLKYLKKFYRGKNSYMEMENGSTISVSTRRKSAFLEMFGG